ncbi:hypothetical protein VNO78_18271 [Psophocarpus tetragonolobus]|uniref:Uncharacterized protein n=1 Tax=Psophocarpus tetragonolobus TaxID=3891 RepID=A0AAN9SI48_PSOTE
MFVFGKCNHVYQAKPSLPHGLPNLSLIALQGGEHMYPKENVFDPSFQSNSPQPREGEKQAQEERKKRGKVESSRRFHVINAFSVNFKPNKQHNWKGIKKKKKEQYCGRGIDRCMKRGIN